MRIFSCTCEYFILCTVHISSLKNSQVHNKIFASTRNKIFATTRKRLEENNCDLNNHKIKNWNNEKLDLLYIKSKNLILISCVCNRPFQFQATFRTMGSWCRKHHQATPALFCETLYKTLRRRCFGYTFLQWPVVVVLLFLSCYVVRYINILI